MVTNHINEATTLRPKSLNDLLKVFVLQHADPTLGAKSGHTACSDTVTPGFRAWIQLLRSKSRSRFVSPWGYGSHANPRSLACYIGWLELVTSIYHHPHDIIDQETHIQLPSAPVKLGPLWYAIAGRKTDLADCMIASATDQTRTISEKGF
ncbi:hypothetical protein F5B17DRAFT_157275 [Nemania serpens]|nr:hypothetical protein F5B17DRAFT_157275 [Nemania serpens]